MSRGRNETKPVVPSTVRCAIYTRKSTEDGLEQEFNSLDAQRESAEAYITSQKADGWIALPDRYDDGGFSGGNLARPAMDRLMADIEAGKVDCVVVYKVDRLSRSLIDFARIMEVFERRHVSFVSVTQHFNTTHSMGRLTLNILLSFAQFEREIIGERIRDKIAAQRRKGKWAGGVPVLGYDIDRSNPSPRLVVNAEEAARVRRIFDLYLEHGALLPTVQELSRRGWVNKQRRTVRGDVVGGRSFDKPSLYTMLVNPIYIGKIVHKMDVYHGEHQAIITPEVFKRVGDLLRQNRISGGPMVRNKYGALLRGLLYCKCCGRAMVHTFAGKVGKKGQHYRYYTCTNAIKRGHDECLSGSLPAAEIERVVVDQVKCIGGDPALLNDVLRQARAALDDEIASLNDERDDLTQEATRQHAEVRRLALGTTSSTVARLGELHERLQRGEQRLKEIDVKIEALRTEQIDAADVTAALSEFDGVWGCLSPRKQARLLALLISKVDYDAHESTVTVSFHAAGIKTLASGHCGEAA